MDSPKDIQQKIVADCEAIDEKFESAEQIIKTFKVNITELLIEINKNTEIKKLGMICNMKAGQFISASDIHDNSGTDLYPCYGGNGLRGYTKTFTHDGIFPLIGRQGALCGNVHKVTGKFHATEHAIVVTALSDIDANWLYYQLNFLNLNQYKTGIAQPGLSVKNLQPVYTPVPSLSQQKTLVAKIEQLENKIATAQKTINEAASKKQAVLKRYL
jgi:restriction endonuclease S subunit